MAIRLAKSSLNFLGTDATNPWGPEDVDKLETKKKEPYDEFQQLVKECRFFYEKDPIASTVINKMVEIGITDLVIEKGKLSANEHRIFLSFKDGLQEFIEDCALEYLLSGLVVPEIKLAPVSSKEIKDYGIKKYSTITLPVSLWLRDPATVKINTSEVMNDPSYYVKIPEKLVIFLTNGGTYGDGTKDPELYAKLLAYYPAFVLAVRNGAREVLLENDLIVRRKVRTGNAYPIPYLKSSLESMKHKRNLRKMDYSIAARVISAIQLFKLGDKDFPVTEDDEEAFDSIKDQMAWRYSAGRDIERIFQLFANHTLQIEWITPDVSALLDDRKYIGVNDDIFVGLGFPRILTTGEATKTGTSDPEFASLSPLKTMDGMRRKLLPIAKRVVYEVATQNNIAVVPEVRFKPVSLHSFKNFVDGLRNLYDTGNISRTTYDDAFGYNLEEELRTKADEQDLLKELKLEEFAPRPFSNQPQVPGQSQPQNRSPNNGAQGQNSDGEEKQ